MSNISFTDVDHDSTVLYDVIALLCLLCLQILKSFKDVVWHASWSITGDILAISGGDNKVSPWLLHAQ